MGCLAMRISRPRLHTEPSLPSRTRAEGAIHFAFHHSRVAYRIAADLVVTRFFGTYQYSPKCPPGL